jgi:hypothetical protein
MKHTPPLAASLYAQTNRPGQLASRPGRSCYIERAGGEITMEFDLTALEMLPGEETEGLALCLRSCVVTCGITCQFTAPQA